MEAFDVNKFCWKIADKLPSSKADFAINLQDNPQLAKDYYDYATAADMGGCFGKEGKNQIFALKVIK